MFIMVVTLAVLKLSDSLNADAPCPVERRAFKAGRVWAGRRERVGVVAVQGACRRGAEG